MSIRTLIKTTERAQVAIGSKDLSDIRFWNWLLEANDGNYVKMPPTWISLSDEVLAVESPLYARELYKLLKTDEVSAKARELSNSEFEDFLTRTWITQYE